MIDLSDLANDLGDATLPNGTPSPYTPEHKEAAASALGYESAAQRDEVDPPKKRHRRTKAEIEAARAAEAAGKGTGTGATEAAPSAASVDGPASGNELEPTPFDDVEAPADVKWDEVPDVTETQVLVDELHFLRDDLREFTLELRKYTLTIERNFEKAQEVIAGKAPA